MTQEYIMLVRKVDASLVSKPVTQEIQSLLIFSVHFKAFVTHQLLLHSLYTHLAELKKVFSVIARGSSRKEGKKVVNQNKEAGGDQTIMVYPGQSAA